MPDFEPSQPLRHRRFIFREMAIGGLIAISRNFGY
jgi:hypothetical protein